MADITTVWTASLDSEGDWQLDGPDLQSGDDIETAVIISLFTDRRADPDDVIPDGSDDPRGWWADGDPEGPIGSKIWLRVRSKIVQQTLNIVRTDIVQALQWLLDDNVCSSISVETEWVTPTAPASRPKSSRSGSPGARRRPARRRANRA
jgi:phage gp46-like protein